MITILFLFLIYEINQLWTAEMKWKWSSQWTQFMQLRKEGWKNSGLQRDGNIWTHNWPAPNVCGFIAQLVEHRTGNREVTGSNPVEVLNYYFLFFSGFFTQLHKSRSLRRSFRHFQYIFARVNLESITTSSHICYKTTTGIFMPISIHSYWLLKGHMTSN